MSPLPPDQQSWVARSSLSRALTGCVGKESNDRPWSPSWAGDRSGGDFVGPIYDSVTSIGAASSSVFTGRFTTFDKAFDDGGDPDGHVQFPMRIGTFTVDHSDPQLPSSIQVSLPIAEEGVEDDGLVKHLADVKAGQTYLIFGEKVSRTQRDGLQQYGDIYNVVGNANDIFTIEGKTATAIGPGVPLTAEQATTAARESGSREYAVDDLLKVGTGSGRR